MKMLWNIPLICVLVSLVNCQDPEEDRVIIDRKQYTIYGTVTDAHTGKPLSGVRVSLITGWEERYMFSWHPIIAEKALTDDAGYYEMTVSAQGELSVWKEYYNGQESVFELFPCKPQTQAACTIRYDFELTLKPLLLITIKNVAPIDESDLLEVLKVGWDFSAGPDKPATPYTYPISSLYGTKIDTTLHIRSNLFAEMVWKDSIYIDVTRNLTKTRLANHFFEINAGDTLALSIEY